VTQPPYAMQPPPPGAYPYPPPEPPQPPQQNGSGLAIASLVLGIIALLLSWIPIVNYVAVILGVVGLVLGIIGIFKSKRTMSIVGSALSLLAIIVSFIAFASFAKSVDDAVTELNSSLGSTTQSDGGTTATDAGAENDAPVDADAPEAQTNARGNVVKGLGEQGGITNSDGAELLTFSVDSITVDPPCSPDWKKYGTPVDAGHHLVAVGMQVTTSAAVTDADYLTVSGYDFKFIGADGITVDSLDSVATYGCLDDTAEFTSDTLGPGQKYAGTVVLDLPAASGTLVLDPSWGQSGGWEYSF
jgi:hypothetical protein